MKRDCLGGSKAPSCAVKVLMQVYLSGFPVGLCTPPDYAQNLMLVRNMQTVRGIGCLPAVLYGELGVDYDMTGCDPADLDPHAVASVFKAFLRERESLYVLSELIQEG